jgi:hypothetical protein
LNSIRDTVRESTWVRHEINVRVHLKPALGRVRLGKLNPLQSNRSTAASWTRVCLLHPC